MFAYVKKMRSNRKTTLFLRRMINILVAWCLFGPDLICFK